MQLWLTAVLIALLLPAAYAQTSALGRGDIVKITVYGHPDLTTEATISSAGSITFPLLGEVVIADRSATEAEKLIADKLGEGSFVRNASVNLFVKERSSATGSSVTLLGQVSRSGKYDLPNNTEEGVRSLVGLLATAGGITKEAADHLFLVRRQGDTQRRMKIDLVDLLRNGNIESDMLLNDGDVILVPQMDVFYVYGQVKKPGRYRLERDMSIMQALSVASGVTDQGSEKGIVLNRQIDDGIITIESALDDQLQPNDVIYVKGSFF